MKRNKRLLDYILKRYDCAEWFYLMTIYEDCLNFQGNYNPGVVKTIMAATGEKFATEPNGFIELRTKRIRIVLT